MKKLLAFLLVITIVLTTWSFSVIPASAEELEIKDGDLIFIEDFNEYAENVNWIEKLTSSSSYHAVSNETLGVTDKPANSWVYTTSGTTIANDASIKPVTLVGDAHAGRGQVLEITGSTTNKSWINLKRTSNGLEGIDRDAIPEGKKIVVEVKYYVPEGSQFSEAAFLSNPTAVKSGASNNTDGLYGTLAAKVSDKGTHSVTLYASGSGKYGYAQARNSIATNDEQWHTVRVIYDTSKDASVAHSDTTRAIFDNNNVYTSYFGTPVTYKGYTMAELEEALANGTVTTSDKYYIKDHPTYPWYSKDEEGTVKQIDYLYVSDESTDVIKSKDHVYSMENFYGTQFSLYNKIGAGNVGKYYIDDLKAYYIDALDFDVRNASDYTEGEVKLTFNQPLKEEFYEDIDSRPSTAPKSGNRKLENFFTLIDKDGNAVEGGIANFALSEDKKVVSITPAATLTKGEDYKIVIDPLLIDVYGQGLNKNGHNNPTYVDLHIAKEAVAFAVESLSQSVFEEYVQGRVVEITANFTKAVKDDATITEGIVVTNTDDNITVARNNGWTAKLSENKKSVEFDFSNLPTANYTITSNSNFVDENDKSLSGALEITIKKSDNTIVFFDEDFEDYTKDVNWINATNSATTSASAVSLTNFNVKDAKDNEKAWTIQRQWRSKVVPAEQPYNDKDEFVGVVDAPEGAEGMSGKVLKIYNNRGTRYNYDYTAVRRNFNKLSGIKFTDEKYKGKKLVYEVDVYSPQYTAKTIFGISTSSSGTIRNGSTERDMSFGPTGSSNGILTIGAEYRTTFASYGPMAMYAQIKPKDKVNEKPMNIKVVVSQTDDVDTYSIFVNGKLIERPLANQTVLEGHEYNDSARHEFLPTDDVTATKEDRFNLTDTVYGVAWTVSRDENDTTPNTFYLDNFKAYMVDEFKVESVTGNNNVFNAKTGTVEYTFNKPVAPSSKDDGVILVDASGKEVTNGIGSVTLSDGGYKMAVKLNEKIVKGLTEYKVKLTEGLRDVDGLPLTTIYKYFEYDVDKYYEKAAGEDDVYLVTEADGDKTTVLQVKYTPATETMPAHMTYTDSKGKSYSATVDTWVRDAAAMKMYTPLTTSKSTSVYAEADAAEISGNTVSTKVTLVNPETEAKSIWCFVAAYGEYNQMIGYKLLDYKEIEASTQIENIPVSFTADTSLGGVEYIRMFLWNSKAEMKSYQDAESL